jgi:hypothetical protein
MIRGKLLGPPAMFPLTLRMGLKTKDLFLRLSGVDSGIITVTYVL